MRIGTLRCGRSSGRLGAFSNPDAGFPMSQSSNILEYLLQSGLFGLGALGMSVLLLLLAFGLLLARAGRRAFFALLAASLVPLGLGALGSLLGHAASRRVLASPGVSATPEQIAESQRIAWSPVAIGGTGWMLVVSLALFGLYVARRRSERLAEGG